jgi:hypothetical protein
MLAWVDLFRRCSQPASAPGALKAWSHRSVEGDSPGVCEGAPPRLGESKHPDKAASDCPKDSRESVRYWDPVENEYRPRDTANDKVCAKRHHYRDIKPIRRSSWLRHHVRRSLRHAASEPNLSGLGPPQVLAVGSSDGCAHPPIPSTHTAFDTVWLSMLVINLPHSSSSYAPRTARRALDEITMVGPASYKTFGL